MALSQDVSKEQVVQCGLSKPFGFNSLLLKLDAVVPSIYRDETLVISFMYAMY